MPKILKIGDGGPDVALLQTRLNARPTALPPLAVDGEFGALTLQRVREFQVNEFAQGIVDAATWARLLDGPPEAKGSFFTQGRYLFDPMGNKVILRGVNKMAVWDFEDPSGEVYFSEIRKTGANTVRIVWLMAYDNGVPTDLTQLDALITNARSSGLVPMIELHDATGNWNGLPQLVSYWLRPDVVALIRKHQAYLLVNIGNEVGNEVSNWDFVNGYTSAVASMRSAGIHTPLVIDAVEWGKKLDILNATAATLIANDPDQNLLFSVHAYWSRSCGYDAQSIRNRLEGAVALGYPLIVGEFSKFGGFPCNAPLSSQCGPGGEIDYQAILQVCHENEIGWYVWEWGPGNALGSPPDPLCAAMDMTLDGMFANLKSGWAEEVATSSPYSLANTSVAILDELAPQPAAGMPFAAGRVTVPDAAAPE
jgi:mannan endo-1,4-beta-mannosidase